MKTKLKYLIPLLLLVACTGNRDADELPAPLFPQPQTVELNTKGGYLTNTLTGDTIKPVINSMGDTVKTGVPFQVKGKVIHPDSVAKPKSFKLPKDNQLTQYNAHPNHHKLPKNLKTIPIDITKLIKIPIPKVKVGDTTHFILNSQGKKVPTAIEISCKGKVVKAIHPKPLTALPMRMKEDATCNIHYLDVDQGMNSSNIKSILEDKMGNLWFTSGSGGVSMYNGESFVHYTTKEGLSSNSVNSILEDKKGNLWFGTLGAGICMYNGEEFVHYAENEGLSNNYVWTILEDKSGNLWFGTWGGGVSRYDGKNFIHYTEKEGLCNNIVFSILEDKKGNLWFGTAKGVCMTNGENFVHYTEKEGLSNNIVLSIQEDKNSNLWFGTYFGGVTKYDGESFVHYTEKEGLINNRINSILEDKSGNIWFGTEGGVSMLDLNKAEGYNGEKIVNYSEKEGLHSNMVSSILEDTKGSLWFGTYGGGVSMYNGASFTHFTEKEGLSNNNVCSIFEDKCGNLWFGMQQGHGLVKYNGKSFIHYTVNEGISNNNIISILEDKKGNIWFGTFGGGVAKFNGENLVYYTEKQGLSHDFVNCMLEDKKGNIWFGTRLGGVCMFNGEYFIHYTEKQGLSNNYVRTILEDNKGNLWFGTYGGGVSMFNGESFIHYTEKEGLQSNVVQSIMEDNKGNLWFGTNGGGVSMYNGASFTHFTEKEGLSNNRVWSILEDKNGNIWISTDKGLSMAKIEKKAENINVNIQTFGKEDGLKGIDFNKSSAFIDTKNRAWWGNNKCLTMLDLNSFKLSAKIPHPRLTGLDINEQIIDYRNATDSLISGINFNGVQRFENYPLNLALSYNKNHLTFHFAAIDWHAPHKIKYSYIMEGLNTTWSKPTMEPIADYRNLPYGTYTFKVCAIGESGEWSEPFEYTFIIHPPWWHTWWARTLYGLTAVLLILGFVRWRTAKLKQRQKELETEVEMATLEIREQKNEAEKQRDEVRKQKEVVEKQKEIVEEAHKEITDSINYAERIQRSFLATKEILDANLKDYFVFFKPKEAVSGDFYWAAELINGNFAWSVADSTGHGVPGAIMSLLNISSLEKSIEIETSPEKILYKTREIIINRLKKDGSPEGGKDGMDCNLMVIDKERTNLTFASANNSVVVIRENEILEFKGDKIPVGKHDRDTESFTLQTLHLQKGDVIYALTDGFQDQFGGDKGKKYMIKNLKNKFLEIAQLPMNEQKEILFEEFENWKANNEQIDDVCIIGVRI